MAANAVKAARSLATTAKKSRASMKQCSAEGPPIDTNPWQTVTPTPCWPLHPLIEGDGAKNIRSYNSYDNGDSVLFQRRLGHLPTSRRFTPRYTRSDVM